MAGRESGDPLTLRFAGDLALRDICRSALAACHDLALPPPDAARLSVVVEELVANLFDHAGLGQSDMIELSLSRTRHGVEVGIADSGAPFDPRSACPSNTPSRGSGAGLDIVRRWAEVRSYVPGPPLNRLHLWVPVRGGASD